MICQPLGWLPAYTHLNGLGGVKRVHKAQKGLTGNVILVRKCEGLHHTNLWSLLN